MPAERKSEHLRVMEVLPSGLPVSEGRSLRGGVFVKSPLLNRLLFVLFLPKQEKNNIRFITQWRSAMLQEPVAGGLGINGGAQREDGFVEFDFGIVVLTLTA